MTQERPNIIMIVADDMGHWAWGGAGNAELATPSLVRLADSGTTFTNFFCTSPVCSPARASILTGEIPSRHGIHDFIHYTTGGESPIDGQGPLIKYLEGHEGYTDALAANGYVCGMIGKWHMGDAHHAQKGFSHWNARLAGGGNYYNARLINGANGEITQYPEQYITDVITGDALAFLDKRRTDHRPFCLCLNHTAPHSPWTRDDHPAAVFDEFLENCAFKSVPEVPPHPWGRTTLTPGSPGERRKTLAGYFTAVAEMDRNIGRILDWLEENNQRQNTLVLFLSDNGMNMGHHGIWGKGNGTFPLNLYDTSVKVPAVASWPAHVPAGITTACLLSEYDIKPTLLEVAELEHDNPDLPGRSFAPLLRGKQFQSNEDVVVFDEYGPARMIRSRDHKYIHRYPYGPHEFYDLKRDPDETNNLYGAAAYQDVIGEMKGRLDKWFVKYSDPSVDGSREPVTGYGQLYFAGARGDGRKAFCDFCDDAPRYTVTAPSHAGR